MKRVPVNDLGGGWQRAGNLTYLHLEFVGPGRLYLVASVDMVGDDVEHSLAVRLRRVEHELEQQEHIEEAVLTLSTPRRGFAHALNSTH